MMTRTLVLLAAVFLVVPAALCAQSSGPAPNIGIEQRLNDKVPLDVQFRDENGKLVTLGDYLGQKPVILVLAYFRCPRLCSMVLNGLTSGLRQLDYEMGTDYSVVTVSIDPREGPDLAAAK